MLRVRTPTPPITAENHVGPMKAAPPIILSPTWLLWLTWKLHTRKKVAARQLWG